MNENPIGIFDSGSGGLTVLDACRNLMPEENYVYVSDSRSGGWGGLAEEQINERVRACVSLLRNYRCKAVVAACNTATEVAIGALRQEYDLPFVGLEPALKPAVAAFPTGRILVLCTPATARQPKFEALVRDYGNENVLVRPQPTLASRIEKNLHSPEKLRDDVERIAKADPADAVVLGCTHYVFLRAMFERLFGGAEHVFDGNLGAAHHLEELLFLRGLRRTHGKIGHVTFDTI